MKLSITALTISFCVGIAIALLSFHSTIIAASVFLFALMQGILFLVSKRTGKKSDIAYMLCLCGIFICIGIVRGQMYEEKVLPDELRGAVKNIFVEVIAPPSTKETTQVVDVAVLVSTSTPEKTDVRLRVTTALYPVFSVGDRFLMSGQIKEGDIILPNPPETNKSFDYKEYLHGHGIVGTIAFPKITMTEDKGTSFIYTLYTLKTWAVEKIQMRLPSAESALASGTLFGTNSFPKNVEDEVRTAGLSHIVVLSGFNVAILVSFILFVLKRVPLVIRIGISFAAVTLFVLMVGAERALFFAMLIYIAFSPASLLHDVSLYLSFLATLGIVSVCELITNYFKRYIQNEFVVSTLATTLSAMLYTTPYLIYTFSSFSLYGIVANLFVIPVVPFLMAFTALFVVFSFVPLLSSLLSFLVYIFSTFILHVAHFVSLLPFAKIEMTLSLSGMVISYALILIVVAYIKYRMKQKEEVVVSKNENMISGIISF